MCGHGIGCLLVWDTPRPIASVRSSQPFHDHSEFKQFRVELKKSYGHPGEGPGSADEGHSIGEGHNVMYFKVLALCEAVLPNRLTSKAKARTVTGRNDALLGYF